MDLFEKLISDTMQYFANTPDKRTAKNIREYLKYMRNNPIERVSICDVDLEKVAQTIENRFGITMLEGTLIESKREFDEWYYDRKAEVKPFFWKRYESLMKNKLGADVVKTIDLVTDKIVSKLENPIKEGKWSRRGMVVGHVQSGKTSNFIGVINKAADMGYKLIIVLAGMQETLRSQTQVRIDEGFVGQDASRKKTTNGIDATVGVGHVDNFKTPFSITDRFNDFDASRAPGTFKPQNYEYVSVLVVKKNVHILKNLANWLKKTSSFSKITDMSLLVIDDEADQASINTNNEDKDPTAINKGIRSILSLFDRKCYLAYTATPFANVFIDPETEDEMYEDDLFPEDFIYSLDPPSNYIGSTHIFGSSIENDIVKHIYDAEDILPMKHKKDLEVNDLPPSLIEALYCHVIAKAIRLLRGQSLSHHSMLVHVSRFKNVQKQVYELIMEFQRHLENHIRNSYKCEFGESITNIHLLQLRKVWDKNFKDIYPDWNKIQEKLLQAIVCHTMVKLINGDSKDKLDYDNFKNGLNVIAIGGSKLSRGLTLEGLTTSYFYRNTSMYDTLMQMGRWFGYRDDYTDLCRLFLTPMTEGYFEHISEVTQELRSEIEDMFAAGMTPRQFGLKVRTHPETLKITATNKMRSAQFVEYSVDCNGRLLETHVLPVGGQQRSNFKTFENLIINLEKESKYSTNTNDNYVWTNIKQTLIEDFIEQYENHPRSYSTSKALVLKFISITKNTYTDWDVVLVNKKSATNTLAVADLRVGKQDRTCNCTNNYIEIGRNRRVGNVISEKAGLSATQLEQAERLWRKKHPNMTKLSVTGKYLRQVRTRPLLILHIIDGYESLNDANPKFDNLCAYGISFPYSPEINIIPVSYAVSRDFIDNDDLGGWEDE